MAKIPSMEKFLGGGIHPENVPSVNPRNARGGGGYNPLVFLGSKYQNVIFTLLSPITAGRHTRGMQYIAANMGA